MFEISIICVILLAISYWAVLWLMGRREDVLHGEFVEAGTKPDEPARPIVPDQPTFPQPPARTVFPKKPVIAGKHMIAEKPIIAEQAAITEMPVQAIVAEQSARTAAAQPAFRPERLQSLLNSIKQDLNQLVQK